ncbi:MAG: hypothetical protein ABSE28_07555 [Candidatus Sulfotelmatobacter sp.]|jgi:hypothetical protein
MRSPTARTEADRYAVIIVTTDERVRPEAETYLVPEHDLTMIQPGINDQMDGNSQQSSCTVYLDDLTFTYQ